MAATNFELKEYQRLSLERLSSYLRDANEHGANLAFYKATNLPFRHAPAVQGNRFWILIVPKREHSGNEPCVLVALVD